MTDTNDLLAGLDTDDTEVVNLLDTIGDAGAEAWVPEEEGEGIQGTLVAIDEQEDQYAKASDPPEKQTFPVWTLELKDTERVRVLGLSTVLRREMRSTRAEVGDLVAVKYFGKRTNKRGKYAGEDSHIYRAVARHAGR